MDIESGSFSADDKRVRTGRAGLALFIVAVLLAVASCGRSLCDRTAICSAKSPGGAADASQGSSLP